MENKVFFMLSQLQIAPTLAKFFGVRLSLNSQAQPVQQILNFAYSRHPIPKVVLLIVINSLDFPFYLDFTEDLSKIHELTRSRDGLLFECKTVSYHTTPAIASILTGLRPEFHRIFTPHEVGKSKIRSILEIVEDAGKKSGIAIETKGSEPLIDKISYVFGVDDREDIFEYDNLIKTHTISTLKMHELNLMFSHLRAIDRFAHRGRDLSIAARVTDENLSEIASAVSTRNGMMLICGDHEMHNIHTKARNSSYKGATVPLIVSCP
jgi:hypothetical protein